MCYTFGVTVGCRKVVEGAHSPEAVRDKAGIQVSSLTVILFFGIALLLLYRVLRKMSNTNRTKSENVKNGLTPAWG